KPSRTRGPIDEQAENIIRRLRMAARVNLRGLRMLQPPPRTVHVRATRTEYEGLIVAIGGTGACLSYMQMLTSLGAELPVGVIGLLPFSEPFLQAFVAYLRKCSTFNVEIAQDGTPLHGGTCYLANDRCRLGVERNGNQLSLRISSSEARGDGNVNAL